MATFLSISGLPSHNPKGIAISSVVFVQMTTECPYTLQWDTPFPHLKIAPFHGGSGPPSNTRFPGPGPSRVLNAKSISIWAAVFAELTSVTDRPADRPHYSIGNNRPHGIYVRSTVMLPKNWCQFKIQIAMNVTWELNIVCSHYLANWTYCAVLTAFTKYLVSSKFVYKPNYRQHCAELNVLVFELLRGRF